MIFKRIFLTIGIIILFVVIAYSLASVKARKQVQNQIMVKYKNFETKNPALDFTLEYPEMGWTPVETAGRIEKYDQVYFRGPVDEATNFTTLIHVTVRPLEAGKTALDLLKAYLKIDSNLSKFKTSAEKAISVGGEKAFSTFCEYEAIPTSRLDVPFASFKKRMVFVVKNDRSYEFTLNTLAATFDVYAPILEHLLKTFKFKD